MELDVVTFARRLGLSVYTCRFDDAGVRAVLRRAADGTPELCLNADRDDFDMMRRACAYTISLWWRSQDKADLGFIVRDEHLTRPEAEEDVRAQQFAVALLGSSSFDG